MRITLLPPAMAVLIASAGLMAPPACAATALNASTNGRDSRSRFNPAHSSVMRSGSA